LDILSTSLFIFSKTKPLKLLFQSTESKIGLKSQTSSLKSILLQNVQVNNAVSVGTIISLQLYPKIHGLLKSKINFSNFTDNKEINGKTSQNNSLAGNLVFII